MSPRDDELARTFAPILRFGPGERYFPTVPFFAAFDTIGGGQGLQDRARVAPTGPSGRISWDSIDAAYRKRVTRAAWSPMTFVPTEAAVFYRVRCLVGKQNKQLWGFLRNDPQAWERSGLDTLYALGLQKAEFAVVEYYLYYVRDVGLEGHPQDIERILVFLPRSVEVTAPLRVAGEDVGEPPGGSQPGFADSLRILVGTGHSSTTPNNVLVLLNGQASTLRSEERRVGKECRL